MNRDNFLQQFQLNPTVGYHPESVGRVSHISGEQLRKAAVVVGLVEREDGLHVIFTKRAAHLKHHPGQVSFPGGKHELSDPSMQFTALRELHEEVGIRSDQVKIVGQLPALSTISKFSVTPIVAMVDPDYKAIIDENEVASIFEVPATYVLDQAKLHSHTVNFKKIKHRVFAMPFEEHLIWGVTAQIIQSLQQHVVQQIT
ncbi:CoA pyrophosphatase [Vibrio splendidus]|uniref:CoA pyrophosphatase n=2 Tax=Vibrio splendidus TaxID=29497 RepID=UPI000C841854|nr:CoA pyrophosphatase [Vibrio splendidus]PMI80896.1 coenzyme A pyrophosphatase [Vibrio splendidus]PMK59810.1 coenzyme A pyrophosphatase [Vibrio splendidus]